MAAVKVATTEEKRDGWFEPAWFNDRDMRIKGFEIKHIEAKSAYLQELKESIRDVGYNKTEPIILATSSDERAMNFVLDGRHRLIACEYVRKETGKLPNIKFVHEKVPDKGHALLQQIAYESQHMLRKGREAAIAHIQDLYQEAEKEFPELRKQTDMVDFMEKEAKFDSQTLLYAVAAKITRFRELRQQKLDQQSRKPADVNEDNYKDWGDTRKEEPKQEAKYRTFAGEYETECDGCHKKSNHELTIKLYDDGRCVVEKAT